MPLNPIPRDSPSFKSSVGSKSTGLHLRGTDDSGNDDDLLVGFHQERRRALRSVWISRLQLPHSDFPLLADASELATPPPQRSSQMLRGRLDSESSGARDRGAISTDESRSPTTAVNPAFAIRRYRYLVDERRAGARPSWSLLPPPRMGYGGGEERRHAVGFGPFQVRAMNAMIEEEEKALGRPHLMTPMGEGADSQWGPNFGFGHMRKLESFNVEKIDQRSDPQRMKMMNLSLFFRHQPPADARDNGALGHQMDDGSTKLFDNWTHRWTSGNDKVPSPSSIHYISSQKTAGEAFPRPNERRVSFGAWQANASVQTGARSRAAAYCDVVHDDSPSSTTFSGHHFQHENMTKLRHKHLLDKKNEPGEQFSFWNLGKFNKGNVVSSAFPTTTSWNLNKKRNANTEGYFLPLKLRKM